MVDWEQATFSSMVQAIAYDSDAGMLVTWVSGRQTLYIGVDEATARQAADAPSVGEFINTEIKGRYNFRNL